MIDYLHYSILKNKKLYKEILCTEILDNLEQQINSLYKIKIACKINGISTDKENGILHTLLSKVENELIEIFKKVSHLI